MIKKQSLIIFLVALMLFAPPLQSVADCIIPEKPFCVDTLSTQSTRQVIQDCVFDLQLFETDVNLYGSCAGADQALIDDLRYILYEARAKLNCFKTSKIC